MSVPSLLEAICVGNARIVSLLLDNGASLNAKQLMFGSLPALQFGAQFDNTEILHLLSDRGADPNAIAGDDATPTHRSLECIPRTAL